ncbi:hypothetical protein A2U01_0091314 [Trifolium medium]|uniref:Uncharacterized protein n=1 Tax=Trifolium medium TaxID=97028 RepID=A0A392U971_9FABA|nr:hypothetical protein [Trifolium medium]
MGMEPIMARSVTVRAATCSGRTATLAFRYSTYEQT